MADYVPNYQTCDPDFTLNRPSLPGSNIIIRGFAVPMVYVRNVDEYPYSNTIIKSFNVAQKQLVSKLPDSNIIMDSMSLSSPPYPLFSDEHTQMRDMRTKVIEMT